MVVVELLLRGGGGLEVSLDDRAAVLHLCLVLSLVLTLGLALVRNIIILSKVRVLNQPIL